MFSTTTGPTLTYRLALELAEARRRQIHPFRHLHGASGQRGSP